ncbi:MAG: RNA methyltransferase [Candidatus Cloacimonetes bacterium]|jgi:TrmH family RNA methyltransferase|nr:RNA methyltransferase [Candidatus Cloacimonadota bacterium]MDY0299051.1 RNA methyltransferase [Candidatus Cloacimonadaceae bacterium]MCK9331555.1 RNA methyltransferase [Candidatus Cloacimonadota bacterium]MDD2210851.1 RNA methyltransferase [Candidatus Cloacimonadota bacterium]MDD4231250.1 RNA methyltransferase [Candidatus Cloacimonadota bacterium]
MPQIERISKAKIAELAKLKHKKYRTEYKRVVVEGFRLIKQLNEFGIKPLELYSTSLESHPDLCSKQSLCRPQDLKRICNSDHPADLAALYPTPATSSKPFKRALYLDCVSDPGNLGTIFRAVSTFGINAVLLSKDSCEIANPKVIRASMGAVYTTNWQYLDYAELLNFQCRKVVLDMQGKTALPQYCPTPEPEIYIFGSEAHGISDLLKANADESIFIPMQGKMESLNLAMSVAILCYHLFTKRL